MKTSISGCKIVFCDELQRYLVLIVVFLNNILFQNIECQTDISLAGGEGVSSFRPDNLQGLNPYLQPLPVIASNSGMFYSDFTLTWLDPVPNTVVSKTFCFKFVLYFSLDFFILSIAHSF